MCIIAFETIYEKLSVNSPYEAVPPSFDYAMLFAIIFGTKKEIN
jgi:hypothetical protein